MRKRSLLAAAVLPIVLALMTAGAALAGSVSVSGTFAGDPTMPVVFISTPDCVGQGTFPVRYDAYPFTVTATGAYTFTAAAVGGGDSSIYIMDAGFNPAAAFPNCIAASNTGSPTLLSNVNLTAGTTYFAVIFEDTFPQSGVGYTFTATGVGDIRIGSEPCKQGGWKTLTDSAGNPFKNQGDCVSYFATAGRNGGAVQP